MVEVEEPVRVAISLTLPKECVAWLDEKVKSRVYANRSHAMEVIVLEAMKSEKKE